MLDMNFETLEMQNRIETYVNAFQNAGIPGEFHFAGEIISRESGIPTMVNESVPVFFTPYKEEDMHKCYAVVDSLDVSIMAGLEITSYHDFMESSSYKRFRKEEWTIDIQGCC